MSLKRRIITHVKKKDAIVGLHSVALHLTSDRQNSKMGQRRRSHKVQNVFSCQKDPYISSKLTYLQIHTEQFDVGTGIKMKTEMQPST